VNTTKHVDGRARTFEPEIRELTSVEMDIAVGGGKRTQINDARDRYANVQVGY